MIGQLTWRAGFTGKTDLMLFFGQQRQGYRVRDDALLVLCRCRNGYAHAMRVEDGQTVGYDGQRYWLVRN